MKIIYSFILITIALTACFIEDLYLGEFPPGADTKVPFTLRTHTPFKFDQDKALSEKRLVALDRYIPLYVSQPQNFHTAKTKMVRLVMKVHAHMTQKNSSRDELTQMLKEDFGLEIDPFALNKMLAYKDLDKLLTGLITLQDAVYREKIVLDLSLLRDKQQVEIYYPEFARTFLYDISEIITLEQARRMLKERVMNLFWKVDKSILTTVTEILNSVQSINLDYDNLENKKRIDDIIDQFPKNIVQYDSGQVLVSAGTSPGDAGLLLLNAYTRARRSDLERTAVWVTLAVILIVVMIIRLPLRSIHTVKNHINRLFFVLVTHIILFRLYLLFAPFPVESLPFALLPLTLLLLKQDKSLVLFTVAAASAIVALFSGKGIEVLLFWAFGGVISVIMFQSIEKKWQVFLPALGVGIVNAVFIGAVTLANPDTVNGIRMQMNLDADFVRNFMGLVTQSTIKWAFFGGLAAGLLALVLLPFMEIIFRSASTFKLRRLLDLNHPLLKDLLDTSPGTYQHTMMVAHLAQTAGEAIGADTLLLRVGAYFHDLGKIMKPSYFVENQFSGKNYHDELEPRESKEIIINHVLEGERLAVSYRLPESIIDMIRQHHGTQIVQYFYNKAQQHKPKPKINPDDYRYPGPKPQSSEAAILMITDTAEAAARSIETPTRDKIEQMLRHVIEAKLIDGQFDDCDLTTRQIAEIFKVLVNALEASIHSRVKYPWQEKKT
ncbi:MAG: HDIG domain-containing protein [Desulfobacteraceae bacterium]|nr:HDIG domain-containing protein [Desulfobacteraceae bacterium]